MIGKLIKPINPKEEVSFPYVNEKGNKEVIIFTNEGILFDNLPKSEDLPKKINYYVNLGYLKFEEVENKKQTVSKAPANPYAKKTPAKTPAKEKQEAPKENAKVEKVEEALPEKVARKR